MSRITLKAGELEILFRVPDVDDLWRLHGSLPVLPIEDAKRVPSEVRTLAHNAELVGRLLCECSIRPKLILESPADIPEGTYPVRELRFADRARLGDALMREAGFTTEAAEKVRPLSETGPGSSSSTGSVNDTENDRATLSPV